MHAWYSALEAIDLGCNKILANYMGELIMLKLICVAKSENSVVWLFQVQSSTGICQLFKMS